MFIVLIYLCNFRSHMIKKVKVPPPNSWEDLALPRYSYKVLVGYGIEGTGETANSLVRQDRLVIHKGKRNLCSEL